MKGGDGADECWLGRGNPLKEAEEDAPRVRVVGTTSAEDESAHPVAGASKAPLRSRTQSANQNGDGDRAKPAFDVFVQVMKSLPPQASTTRTPVI